MSDIAIRCEGLGKLYKIEQRERYKTLSGALTNVMYAPIRKIRRAWQPPLAESHNERHFIWALKDVSFEVKRGEVIGVIGRNGAGKTTLLKILSQITEPTEGRAEVNGRVGSLLEVGTGFHPELTGRENIYLNGAILGMKKREIVRKFDEIVDFAEVEKFIDTPVKRYSTGMQTRLAFAVAAHLEREILLVDEVLAVGDAAFQKKCLGKMGDVASEGRTVFFVSHNMGAIGNLCGRAVWLNDGAIAAIGDRSATVRAYLQFALSLGESRQAGVIYRATSDPVDSSCYIAQIDLRSVDCSPAVSLHTGEDVRFRVHFNSTRRIPRASIVLDFKTMDGTRLLRLSSAPLSTCYVDIEPGSGFVDCVISKFPFSAGTFVVGGGIALAQAGEWLFYNDSLATMDILPADVYHSGRAPSSDVTLIAVEHRWERPQGRD